MSLRVFANPQKFGGKPTKSSLSLNLIAIKERSPDRLCGPAWSRNGHASHSTVIQENVVSHTGADAPTRVLGQPIFDGAIGEGKRILIVDDVVTFGATLANLRGFIQSCGSIVVGASTLSASYGGTKLALPDHVKQSLFERFPSVAELAHGLGFESDCFTNREARFLAALKEARKERAFCNSQGSAASQRSFLIVGFFHGRTFANSRHTLYRRG